MSPNDIVTLFANQGLAVILVLGGGWFITVKVWPTIVDLYLRPFAAVREAQLELLARAVVALEVIASIGERDDEAGSPKPEV